MNRNPVVIPCRSLYRLQRHYIDYNVVKLIFLLLYVKFPSHCLEFKRHLGKNPFPNIAGKGGTEPIFTE